MWKVLIVEDEVHSREYIKKIVKWEEQGFILIGESDNGLEALRFLDKTEPDLIICDIIMPHMDGVELLKKLRCQGYDGAVVMLTCVGEFEYARQALESGASGYILKLSMGPEILKEMLAKVSRELWQRDRSRRLNQVAQDLQIWQKDQLTDHAEINKVLSFIQRNFEKPIMLKSMSEYVNMAPSYLSDLFKKKTGETLIYYLHRIRVEEAKILLRTTTLSVGVIANQVGFESDNYFIKIFKRREEVTPAEYRKKRDV